MNPPHHCKLTFDLILLLFGKPTGWMNAKAMMANVDQFIHALVGYDVDAPVDKNAKNAAKLLNENRESMTVEIIR